MDWNLFLFGLRKETVALCILLLYTELFQEIWHSGSEGLVGFEICVFVRIFLLHDSIKASAIVSKCISYVDNIFLSILIVMGIMLAMNLTYTHHGRLYFYHQVFARISHPWLSGTHLGHVIDFSQWNVILAAFKQKF